MLGIGVFIAVGAGAAEGRGVFAAAEAGVIAGAGVFAGGGDGVQTGCGVTGCADAYNGAGIVFDPITDPHPVMIAIRIKKLKNCLVIPPSPFGGRK